MSGDNCEKSVFLGTKRHPERYECELPDGHDGLHRAEAASHNFMTGSDAVLLHWQKVEDGDTVGDDASGDRVRSEAEKRDTCDNGHCNGGPSPAASEDVSEKSLEPVGYITGDGTAEGGALEFHWPDEIEGRTYQSVPQTVFTAGQILELMYENPNLAVLREKLEEFTQNGGTE